MRMINRTDGSSVVYGGVLTPSVFDRGTLSYQGAVYRNRRLVEASQRRSNAHWRHIDPIEAPPVRTEATRFRGIYLGHFFSHFGHFLIETLPMLHWAKGHSGPYYFHAWKDAADTHRNNRLALPHAQYCLDLLGIDRSRVVFAETPTRVLFLSMPPRANSIEGEPDQRAIKVYGEIARRTMERLPDSGVRRVYLSRRLFKEDRGNNEEEVEDLFRARGFRVVHPEKLPFPEQVNLVARADIIAGLNGSAMHLGVFLRPGAWQIDLGRRGWKIQKAILDLLDVRGDMLPSVAPWKTEDRPLDVEVIREWLDRHLPD